MNFIYYTLRGGSWIHYGRSADSGVRNGYDYGYSRANAGFRIVKRKL